MKSNPSKSKKPVIISTVLLILALAAAAAVYIFFEGEKPTVELNSKLDKFLPAKTVLEFKVNDQRSGIKSISIELSQGDKTATVFSKVFPRPAKAGIKPETVSFPVTAKDFGFKDGDITLTVTATDFSLRSFFAGNKTTYTKKFILDTVAPKIRILHSEKYINQGGTGIFIYKSTDGSIKTGLEQDGNYHPGFKISQEANDDTYIVYFGLPYNASAFQNSFIVSTDEAGNTARVPVNVIFKKSNFKQDTINIPDSFLNKKIPEFKNHYPEMQGDNLTSYLYTNNEIRRANNAKIASLCKAPHADRMWEGRFLRMAGSRRANFADHRTYYYNGKAIDKQVHLGVDLASTQQADIKAANGGIVVFSEYLGIYGNMVILDHGQGVFSLYSHLSQINVSNGDTVKKGDIIAQSGKTGMAGGDHLHFSMLVNGIFVTPVEWWDQHWIDITIDEPLIDSKF